MTRGPAAPRAAARAGGARAGLLLISLVALLGALAVLVYCVALLLVALGHMRAATASDAFQFVRTANSALLVAIVAGWTPLLRWVTAAHGTHAARRAILPGPFGGEPALLLAGAFDHSAASLRGAARLAPLAAGAWPLGLVASHVVHPLACVVGGAWCGVAVVAWRLRAAIGAESVRQRLISAANSSNTPK